MERAAAEEALLVEQETASAGIQAAKLQAELLAIEELELLKQIEDLDRQEQEELLSKQREREHQEQE